MQEKILRKGAEAELIETEFLDNKALLKKRIVKNYRVKKLDDSIRRERTKQEAILLHRAKEAGVRTPIIYQIDKKNCTIAMEFVLGSRLKDSLNKKNFSGYCKTLGEQIAFLHSAGIIHGDLTTSNVIVNQENALVLIDFGLGFFSEKIEDKAVDLLNLKKTFEATHHSLMPNAWQEITSSYCNCNNQGSGEKVLSQLSEIEKRARYL
jgi:Kae1-associated kinase Bud32